MIKQEYIAIRDNPQADTMKVYHFYHELKRKPDQVSLSFEQFKYYFSYYMMSLAFGFVRIQYKVFKELDQYFKTQEK